jgi:hypothetical protein
MPPEDTAPATGAPAAPAAPSKAPAVESDDDIIASITRDIADAKDDVLAAEADDEPAPKKGKAEADDEDDDSDDSDEPEATEDDGEEDDAEDRERDTEPAHPEGKRLKKAQELLEEGDLEGALKLAFGKDPAFFKIDGSKFVEYRDYVRRGKQWLRAHEAKLVAREQDFRGQVQETLEQLRPAANLIKLQQEFATNRDYASLIQLCEGITGEQWDVINKNCLKGAKRSPEALRIQQQLDALREEIKKRDQQAEQQKQQLTQEQVYAKDLEAIRGQLGKHPVRKVPQFERRIYNVLAKTRDPHLGLTLTVEEAAARVIRGEKKRVEKSRWLLESGKKPQAAEPEADEAPAPKGKPGIKKAGAPLLRRDSQANGATSKDESDDEIIKDLQRQISRGRVASRKKAS